MSDAFECDRCGSLESGEPAEKVATKSVSVEDSPPAGSIKIERVENIPAPTSSSIEWDVVDGDLCEDCADAFREFWGGGDD